MRYKAIAVRPYPNPLRARVVDLLAQAGVTVDVSPELEGAVTNNEVVARLKGRRPDVLLVPFHALRDKQDERTTGLEVVSRLRSEVPELRETLVVMPVSVFGHLAFEAAWRLEKPDAVLPLVENDVDDASFVLDLRAALLARQRAR